MNKKKPRKKAIKKAVRKLASKRKAKPMKAWAIKNSNGNFLSGAGACAYPTKSYAKSCMIPTDIDVVRVLITEIGK